MANEPQHEIFMSVVELGLDREHTAHCSCGWRGDPRPVRQWAIQDANNHIIAAAAKKGTVK